MASVLSRTRACLARIAADDRSGPNVRAVLSLDPGAESEAQALDRRQAAGNALGPLGGMPILVKDNIDVAGLPTSVGTRRLAGWRPEKNATVVARLRAAGAVILGKTNLHELALAGTTASALGGQTLNPRAPGRTPGGSSGGSAAALAAGFCDGALGTDTLNSLRSPASACGIVALRPTFGLLPRTGVVPVSPSQDVVGPMVRKVADVALMLEAMIGPADPGDSANALSVGQAQGGYVAALKSAKLAGARLGVLAGLFGRAAEHEGVNALIRGALDRFAQAGATIVDIADPVFDSERLIETLDVNLIEFREAFDAWLAQAKPRPPIESLAAFCAARDWHPSIGGALEKAMTFARATDAPDYLARRRRAVTLRRRVVALMNERQLDALVYPLQKCPVVRLDVPVQRDRNGILAAATGLPAIDIPMGEVEGVPVGLDLLGQPWSEARLIALAQAGETALMTRAGGAH